MRFHFDPKQKHQLDAIDAVLRVFEGQPAAGNNEAFHQAAPGEAFAETGFANRLALDEKQILENVQTIQRENISKHGKWKVRDELAGMHFSVEMETGTGKTYVYLRTIYELRQKHGFRKFVIVVPSLAVREGVLKKPAHHRTAPAKPLQTNHPLVLRSMIQAGCQACALSPRKRHR